MGTPRGEGDAETRGRNREREREREREKERASERASERANERTSERGRELVRAGVFPLANSYARVGIERKRDSAKRSTEIEAIKGKRERERKRDKERNRKNKTERKREKRSSLNKRKDARPGWDVNFLAVRSFVR